MSSDSTKSEVIFEGIPASPGIAHGAGFVYRKSELEVPEYQVPVDARPAEIKRLGDALIKTRGQIAVGELAIFGMWLRAFCTLCWVRLPRRSASVLAGTS